MVQNPGLFDRLLGRGRRPADPADWPERPDGPVVWLHVPGPGSRSSMRELARRLAGEESVAVVVTGDEAVPAATGIVPVALPDDTRAGAFLDHWRPDVAVFAEGTVFAPFVVEASRRSIPLVMVEGRVPSLVVGRRWHWPGELRGLLGRFARIVVVDEAAARLFRRKGASEQILRVEGRMEEGSSVLPCTEAERSALVRQFQTRPVWLAVGVAAAEDAAVIAAHRAALRVAHRLLLIVVPDEAARAEAVARMMSDGEGWTVARRSADEEPDEETEVFLAEGVQELGLWYRLAPVTFLGGTLLGEGSTRSPSEAAALGSAILHGPRWGNWSDAFARLTEARATRPVHAPGDLAEGLADLLAPDRVARLAQGAWAASSAGTETTDRVIALLRDLIGARA
jgi:3-deoxy-D-manno-octulosonic-acid transferase